MDLLKKKCVPCEGGAPPLAAAAVAALLPNVSGWENIENKKIKKEFKFADFKQAIAFVDRMAVLAESEGHHPDIEIYYNKLIVTLWTHAVGGLSENDFIMAAKIDALPLVSVYISIDDFAKVHIKMGKVLSAERIEGSDKLLKLSVDLGEAESRIICSGVAQYYQPEEMIGKMVPVIANLAPRKMRGTESNGMVLFAIDERDGGHKPVLLNPLQELPPGSPAA